MSQALDHAVEMYEQRGFSRAEAEAYAKAHVDWLRAVVREAKRQMQAEASDQPYPVHP